ncbi:hypothetical protein, partial [Klebsiella pneumoniae]|uniref:hypothetical protein n=1 Tax=Klebsiella pneumoniae TaxID=573 RepID=UPI0013D514FF
VLECRHQWHRIRPGHGDDDVDDRQNRHHEENTVKGPLCWIGWLATAVMAAAVIGMIVTSLL